MEGGPSDDIVTQRGGGCNEAWCTSKKKGRSFARPWFVSHAGFTPEAREYAQREGIMVSSRLEVETLAKAVGEVNPACWATKPRNEGLPFLLLCARVN